MSPRFRLRHPTEPNVVATYAVAGDDLFADVYEEFYGVERQVWVRGSYDVSSPAYDTVEPVQGLLRFLAEEGFFDLTDVGKALKVIRKHGLGRLRGRLRKIGEVLQNLDGTGMTVSEPPT